MSSSDRVALVTGAGSGIGQHSSVALAAAGYAVVLAGRRQETLEETVTQIEAAVPDARTLVVPTDVGEPAAVDNLFGLTQSTFGRLDVLFNNAGMGTPAIPLEDLTFEQWSAIVGVNLTGAFLCTQAAFRLMKAQDPRGGRIINNGSVSAQMPRPFSVPYTATKHAITGMTKATALDGRDFDIACGQIDIGNAATNMTQRMTGGVPQANGTKMVEPRMDVSNVSDAVVHMASLPLDANILFMTVMATKMPYVGRG